MPDLIGHIFMFHCDRNGNHALKSICPAWYELHNEFVTRLGKGTQIKITDIPECMKKKTKNENAVNTLYTQNSKMFNEHPFVILTEDEKNGFLAVPLKRGDDKPKIKTDMSELVIPITSDDIIGSRLCENNNILCDRICRLQKDDKWHFDRKIFGEIRPAVYKQMKEKVLRYISSFEIQDKNSNNTTQN